MMRSVDMQHHPSHRLSLTSSPVRLPSLLDRARYGYLYQLDQLHLFNRHDFNHRLVLQKTLWASNPTFRDQRADRKSRVSNAFSREPGKLKYTIWRNFAPNGEAGAQIGGIAGGGSGAAIGAGVGALGGFIAKKMSKGDEAVVKQGTEFGVILNRSISLPRYAPSATP